jgi:histone-lysine N-methyltransferase SETMAR
MIWRQSNNQWSIAANPAPPQKNSECKNPLEKFSSRFFWDQDDILLIDYLPKGQTINAEYYLSLLVQLNDILKVKCHATGRTRRGSCSCPAHRALATQKNLAYMGFHYLDHPPYSPGLAPSDYHLFLGLKKHGMFAIFLPTRRSLLPRRPGWTDNLLDFFVSGLQV